MEKEQYIQDILNSTNGITKATPNVALFQKIEQRLEAEKKAPIQLIWMVAASIVVLLGINIMVMANKSATSDKQSVARIAATLQTNNQFY
jgi:hypothetical protein